VIESPAWPEKGASVADWVEALLLVPNDLEAPALRIQRVIGEVLAALRNSDGALLARMSGSGATCFALFSNAASAAAAATKISAGHPAWWVHAGTLS
jgi:4-diphosphocytidyl-2-C-methyl-D-erythritol kinase